MELLEKIGVEIVVTGIEIDNIPCHLSYYDRILVLCLDDRKRRTVEKQISKLSDELKTRIEVGLTKVYFTSL